MRNIRRLSCLVLCFNLALGVALAAPRTERLPHRFLPRSLDGDLVQVTSPADGTTWAAWSYRNGGEYDIAVASLRDDGRWSEPLLIGEHDRADQIGPSLIADGNGNVYLAYANARAGQLFVALLRAGEEAWRSPRALTYIERSADSPQLAIIGDRLIVAFQADAKTEIVHIPLAGPGYGEELVDNPDPVDDRPDTDPIDPWDWDDDDSEVKSPKKR